MLLTAPTQLWKKIAWCKGLHNRRSHANTPTTLVPFLQGCITLVLLYAGRIVCQVPLHVRIAVCNKISNNTTTIINNVTTIIIIADSEHAFMLHCKVLYQNSKMFACPPLNCVLGSLHALTEIHHPNHFSACHIYLSI